MAVVKPSNVSKNVVVHTHNCHECDSYIKGSNGCKKHGNLKKHCFDGRKTIKIVK